MHLSYKSIEEAKILVLNTHPEYWSEVMYNNLINWLNHGGNLIYLGGNGIYWKVTVNKDQLEVRKEGKPLHEHDGTKGGQWRNLGRPESAILGVQYDRGGYNTYFPYKVILPDHMVFGGLDLKKNSVIGSLGPFKGASGKETDKITEFSPKNIQFLAIGLNKEAFDEIGKDGVNKQGGANMVYYEHSGGGQVFSVGSIAFGSFLRTDDTISKLTKNVFDYFLGKGPE